MNERIKELAKQADPEYTGNGDDIDMGDSLVGNHAIEKFAELIVQECIDKLSGLVVVSGDDDAFEKWNLALGHAELEIKEHFGIEE